MDELKKAADLLYDALDTNKPADIIKQLEQAFDKAVQNIDLTGVELPN